MNANKQFSFGASPYLSPSRSTGIIIIEQYSSIYSIIGECRPQLLLFCLKVRVAVKQPQIVGKNQMLLTGFEKMIIL